VLDTGLHVQGPNMYNGLNGVKHDLQKQRRWAVPYGGRQDARLEPKYIHDYGYGSWCEPQPALLARHPVPPGIMTFMRICMILHAGHPYMLCLLASHFDSRPSNPLFIGQRHTPACIDSSLHKTDQEDSSSETAVSGAYSARHKVLQICHLVGLS
jgi:hypothetical protein